MTSQPADLAAALAPYQEPLPDIATPKFRGTLLTVWADHDEAIELARCAPGPVLIDQHKPSGLWRIWTLGGGR